MGDVFIPALTRTILRRSVADLATIEPLATVGASKGAAIVTEPSRWGSWMEHGAALLALFDHTNIGNTPRFKEVGACAPNCVVRLRMTSGAEGDEIAEAVSFSVIIKQMERFDVVDRQMLSLDAAVLTCVAVALPDSRTLLMPVRPTIACVPAKPCGIVLTTPGSGRSPLAPALTITEIVFMDRIWLSFDLTPAGVTDYRDPFAPDADAMLALPEAVALGGTESRRVSPIGLDIKGLTALLADYSFHARSLPHMENKSRETLCNANT